LFENLQTEKLWTQIKYPVAVTEDLDERVHVVTTEINGDEVKQGCSNSTL
jgi:hypothetical protein